MSYATYRVGDLVNDYRLLDQVQENYFDHNDEFTTDHGFNIAAGIVQIDTVSTGLSIEDPEIGTLKMYRKTWDFINEDEYKGNVEWSEIGTHFCLDQEFNDVEGNNEETKFYPTDPFSEKKLKLYGNKLKCMDEENNTIFGNYNSPQANNLVIVFELCNPDLRKCKSDSEIK